MKRVPESALTRAALAKGAVVAIGGRTLNAAGSKMQLAAPVEKPATIAPAPPPVRVEMDTTALAQVVESSERRADHLARMVAALVAEMRAQRDASPAPITAWEFKVHRDKQDRLDTLRATAIR